MIIKIAIWNIAYIFISNYNKFSFEMHENLFSINYDFFSVIRVSFLNRDFKKRVHLGGTEQPKDSYISEYLNNKAPLDISHFLHL